jgi:hypothetical protein
MDSAGRPEHSTGQDDAHSLQLLALLGDPGIFQTIVDSLPSGVERLALRLWGMIRGHYPLTQQTLDATRDELEQVRRSGQSGPAPDSA